MALIKTYNSVPSVYTHQSRDFQLIGHIYEAMFNSSKLATDMLNKMMPNSDFDERLLNLSTTTTGFIRKHEYNTMDLTMILSSFAHLLRIKGTKSAIESALNILLRSQGISDPYAIDIDSDNKLLTLYLSERLEDVVLLTDLFDYILPFGFNYRIIQSKITSASGYPTEIEYQDVQSGDNKITVTTVGNEPIVNDTFITTIEHTLPEMVDARPIRSGQIDGNEPTSVTMLSFSPKSPDSTSPATWSTEWSFAPVVGYPCEVTITFELQYPNVETIEKTFVFTPSDNNSLYYWQITMPDDVDPANYITVTSSADGSKITAYSAEYRMSDSKMGISVVGVGVGRIFSMVNTLPSSTLGLQATWNTNQYWIADPESSKTYNVTVSYAVANVLAEKTFSWVPSEDDQRLYHWQTTLYDSVNDENIIVESSDDGSQITTYHPGIPQNNVKLTVNIVDTDPS